jgi:hypothetical protein
MQDDLYLKQEDFYHKDGLKNNARHNSSELKYEPNL